MKSALWSRCSHRFVNRNRRPSGRKNGPRCEFSVSERSSFVSSVGDPPDSWTRSNASRFDARKMMSPRAPQAPSWNPATDAIVWGGPPDGLTFLSFPSAKNATQRPSGDQIGSIPPSVPGNDRLRSESSDWIHSSRLFCPVARTNTKCRPSGDGMADSIPLGRATCRGGRHVRTAVPGRCRSDARRSTSAQALRSQRQGRQARLPTPDGEVRTGWASMVTDSTGAVTTSSSPIRTSPMSRMRRRGSFSRHRRSNRPIARRRGGSAAQSGSRCRIAAIVSVTVAPRKPTRRSASRRAHSRTPRCRFACRPPDRAPVPGSCTGPCRG